MKGVKFNLLETFVCDGWGDQAYEEILASCHLGGEGVFIGPATQVLLPIGGPQAKERATP